MTFYKKLQKIQNTIIPIFNILWQLFINVDENNILLLRTIPRALYVIVICMF